ncbi:TPA: tetratricopeptide repeat protein, partial [Listeria innocua]
MQEGNLEEAVKLFTEVIEEHPSDPVGYINFGNVLLSMDDFERAELFFKRALE